ncbi:unnamed protein product [Lymnaea stagnalis]|uniref:CCDC92/74 N-terminal domain-containing protein n=1 Tax=Lymnaea stagnalis TaxID=6523 RepID=A0AAV2HQ02_LYMST
MGTETAMQKRSYESSIKFMQQEHAFTLKALHEEIMGLQKKCTDLTFQLTMQGLTIDESGHIDNEMQQVQEVLESSKEKIAALEKELADRDKKIQRLEAEAKSQRKRWLDENRIQSQSMNTLRAELEAKANNIAYLTSELYRLKQRSKSEHHEATTQGLPNSSTQQSPPVQQAYLYSDSSHSVKKTLIHQHFIPAPPPRDKTLGIASATSRLRRAGQKPGGSGNVGKPVIAIHGPSSDTLIIRKSNQMRVSSSRSSGSDSPDITPFLPPSRDEVIQVVGAKQAPILPPIQVSANAHPVLVHHVVSSTSQNHQRKTSSTNTEAAIVTLAVENAAANDGTWKLAHESRSSEYN